MTLGKSVIVYKKEIRSLDVAESDEIENIYKELDITEEGYVLSPKEYVLVSLVEKQ